MRIAMLTVPLMLLAVPVPAGAQTEPPVLKAKDGKPFVHKPSGMTLPATLIGIPRATGREYVAPQLDISFGYNTADQGEVISVYVYRVNAGAPALWFDAAVRSVELREKFGRRSRVDMPAPFAPPGETVASALRAAWTISDGPYRSTALAIVPRGEWLVKLRFSSRSSEAATLLRRLDAVMAELGWPARGAPGNAAVPVTDCTTPLKLDGASKPAAADGTAAVADAMIAAADSQSDKAMPLDAWCRETKATSPVPLYRPVGSDDRYLGTLSDSGQALWVRPGLPLPDRPQSWSVSIVRAGETINFAGRDRLPPPTQLAEIIGGNASSRVSTWGKKRNITLDSALLK